MRGMTRGRYPADLCSRSQSWFSSSGPGCCSGYNRTQAAAEWDSGTHACGAAGPFEKINDVQCLENPCEGGGTKMLLGVGLIVAGGVAGRYGAA